MKNFIQITSLVFILIFCSCSNDEDSDQKIKEPDIYVVGYEYSGLNSIAALWENTTKTYLSKATEEASIHSIFIKDNIKYSAGYEVVNNKQIATLWIDDIPNRLSNQTKHATAFSVFVDNSDVYVVGKEDNKPILWKNGKEFILSNLSASFTGAYSVFVKNKNVYIAGKELNIIPGRNNFEPRATYWKNGLATNLSFGDREASASAIFEHDGNIYVTGFLDTGSRRECVVWKNGTLLRLTPNSNGMGNTIYVNDNGVYVGGNENDKPTIWKNGIPRYLSKVAGDINSIIVKNDKVYATGYEKVNGKNVAKLWIDDSSINLTDGIENAVAFSVFIKE